MMWLIANRKIVAKFIFAAVAIALLFLCYFAGERAGSDKVQDKWDADKLKQTQLLAEANQKVLDVERAAAELLAKKQKDLEDEKRKTEILMAGADSRLNGLQNTVNRLKAQLSNSPGGSSQSNAAIAGTWDLLADCAGKYTAMGKVADIQRDDLAEWQAYGETINQFREDVKKLENVKDNLM